MLTKEILIKTYLIILRETISYKTLSQERLTASKLKKKKKNKKNPVQYYFGENSHLGNRRKYNFFRFKIRPSIFSVL